MASRETMGSVELARRCRAHALRMTSRARSSHIGSCLSAMDILAVLYADFLNFRPEEPDWKERDRFVMSKGHAAAALYAILAESGFFPLDWLERFGDNDQTLAGHVTRHGNAGVEMSTGSLGHGLPVAAGMALGLKKTGSRSVVLISDGECDEGTTWEAALFAAHHKLSNLTAIVDYNKIQSFGRVSEVLGLEPLTEKWRAFGWTVAEVNGHDHEQILSALSSDTASPKVIIAHTVKGKGVSFMEDKLSWHYSSPSPEQLLAALAELERGAVA